MDRLHIVERSAAIIPTLINRPIGSNDRPDQSTLCLFPMIPQYFGMHFPMTPVVISWNQRNNSYQWELCDHSKGDVCPINLHPAFNFGEFYVNEYEGGSFPNLHKLSAAFVCGMQLAHVSTSGIELARLHWHSGTSIDCAINENWF